MCLKENQIQFQEINCFAGWNIMTVKTITRKSLGRSAAIGDLYDATTDSFCETSIFGNLVHREVEIKTAEHHATLVDVESICHDESAFNNLIKYSVEPELAVSWKSEP